jgi:2-polyprenyl-3-methyl-5-hydroxy-6-metoxy-1,4-benzoquinol methylase
MSRFDEKAQDWDTPERRERAAAIAATIREHVPLDREMRAIDIGAGTGLLGLELARDVGSMVLAEPSDGMLAVAREKLANGEPANVTAIPFDIQAGSQGMGPFDLAVSLLVLHHVEDTAAALRTIHDLLDPGGRIALLDLDSEDGTFHDDPEGIHHHGFDAAMIGRLATEAGFLDAETRIVAEIERDGRPYPLFLLTGRRSSAA